MGRTLVTSALIYANGDIHLGHVAGAYLPADIYVRYLRRKGEDVLFISGTDEHGVPITIAAEKAGKTPLELVDYYYERINDGFSRFGMSWENYSRTSREVHYRTTTEIFKDLYNKGYMLEKTESQHYCVHDKRFLPDRYVVGKCHHCGAPEANGTECETCGKPVDALKLVEPKCKTCGNTPEIRETTHLYIRLDKFQKPLEEWVGKWNGWKENVVRQTKGILEGGLRERAVTRDLDWGIPVPIPGYEGKVIYVWFDAPIGYISSTIEWAEQRGHPDCWKDYWQDPSCRLVHFIGKDNIFFHTLLFPATLMAVGGYILPENVPANEYLNFEGLKFSTSRGHAVWLNNYLDKFDPDPLRYFLCANMPELRDADFTWPSFQTTNNSDLSGTLGNLTKRVLDMTHRYFEGKVPPRHEPDENTVKLLDLLNKTAGLMGDAIESYRFRLASEKLMDLARAGNLYLQTQEPWQTIKNDRAKCETTLNVGANLCAALAVLMEPILPFGARKLWQTLRHVRPFEQVGWDEAVDGLIQAGQEVDPGIVLYPNIPDEAIQAELGLLETLKQENAPAPAAAASPAAEKAKSTITIDEFRRLDLRVAEVLTAYPVKKADKLLKLRIRIGDEERDIVAGIAQHYTPEEMVGKRIVVVANLEPATIRGIESRGMLLAARDGETLCVIIPEEDIASGSSIQ